jgi:Family of unknown function (DUF5670)
MGDTKPRMVPGSSPRRSSMLWTIFMILLVMWLLGMVTSYTMNGFIHILLVVAVVVLLVRIIQGNRPVV